MPEVPFIAPDDILHQYDEMLLGNRTSCSVLISAKENGNKYTDAILRYCFDKYLGWGARDVVNRLTKEIVSQFKLTSFISKRIDCPPELEEWEFQYVGWYLFPETHSLTSDELTVKVYMEILEKKRKRFPKYFFDETDGEHRALVCFKVMSNEFIQPESIEKLYYTFANEKKAKSLLNKYKLSVPSRSIFGSPIDYLHETLRDDNIASDELYEKYCALAKEGFFSDGVSKKSNGIAGDDDDDEEDYDDEFEIIDNSNVTDLQTAEILDIEDMEDF